MTNSYRYSRQQYLEAVTAEEERNIHKATVVCVGAGGVASSLLQYLTGMGVGKLVVIDCDTVDITILHRYVIHQEDGYLNGVNKAVSAKYALYKLNSYVIIEALTHRLNKNNIDEILSNYAIDVLVDTTDNPETRFCVGDYCQQHKIRHIYAAAVKFNFQVISFNTVLNYPCFNCIFPKIPSKELYMTAASQGVAGPVVGVCGTIAGVECFKMLCFQHNEDKLRYYCLIGKMIFGDCLNGEQRIMRVSVRKGCVCYYAK